MNNEAATMASSRGKDLARIMVGGAAIAVALVFLTRHGNDPAVVVASLYFILACATDALQAKIPNLLNAALAIAGMVLNYTVGGLSGLSHSLLGLGLGIGLLFLPWLMGGFGAGDVKALGALGALLGPRPLLHVFVYMAFFGGAMAILHYLVERNIREKAGEWWLSVRASVLLRDPRLIKPAHGESLRFPYAAAIAFGYYTYLSCGGVL
jgi:prepilin peptidase CpaA